MDPQKQDPASPLFVPEDLGSATRVALDKKPQDKKAEQDREEREAARRSPASGQDR